MGRVLGASIAAMAVAALGCGDQGFEYFGEPGVPVAARYSSWVPGIEVGVDGGVSRDFLVDTGSPLTVLDTNEFPDRGDGLHDVDLAAFALEFPAFTVAVFDVFAYEQDEEAGFAGIVGGDLLSEFALRLDYRGDRVWLEADLGEADPGVPGGFDASTVEGAETVALDVEGGGLAVVPGDCGETCGNIHLPATRALVEVQLEDSAEPIWMLVDTGASSVVVDQLTIEALPDPERPRLEGVTVGTASGEVTAYFTRVRSMGLGMSGVEERDLPVLVLPEGSLFDDIERETGVPVKGLVGGTFLRSYLTTIDFPGERLALARYLDQSHIDADEFVRVGFTMAKRGGAWEVRDVYPGTDAAAEGIVSGDRVASVDTEAVADLSEEEVSAIFGRFELGDEVPVSVERGTETHNYQIAVEDLLPRFEAP